MSSRRVDKILDLIDAGLCDVGKQSSDEHPYHLDEPFPPLAPPWSSFAGPASRTINGRNVLDFAADHYGSLDDAVAYVRLHTCVPECDDDSHIASEMSGCYARSGDEGEWTSIEITGFVLDLGSGETIVGGRWLGERVADESD